MTHHKIILGDCLEGMKLLDDESVDLVVTSPPFNKAYMNRPDVKTVSNWRQRNIKYGDYGDNLPEDEYQGWQVAVLDEFYRLLNHGGSVFYNHKNRIKDNAILTPYSWMLKSKLTVKQEVVWLRGGSPQTRPVRFLPNTERLFHLTKGGSVRFNREALRFGEVWNIAPVQNPLHPATFPKELVERCLVACSQEGHTILDPFAGSFTTSKVARDLGRNSISIEINPDYWYNIGETRLRAKTPTLDKSVTFEIINLNEKDGLEYRLPE